MIDASASMLETISKTSQASKSRVSDKSSTNSSKEFSGYMEESSKNKSPITEENREASDNRSNVNEEESEQPTEQGYPVSADVMDKPDQAREKIANLLTQRASILEKLTNTQDALSQKQLAAVEKVLDLDRISDDLTSKLIEKLNLNKTKGELNFHNRLLTEKNLVNLDVADSMANRMATEGADKGSLLNSLNSSERLHAATSLQQMKMSTPINSTEWSTEFGKRIQMLIRSNIQHAEIRLDPPELGRIQIRINLTQDQANISFSALNANAREAIDSSMNRLREMLSETGLQLGEANVGGEFQQQTNHRTDEREQFFTGSGRNKDSDENNDPEQMPSAVIQRSMDGVIDYFA